MKYLQTYEEIYKNGVLYVPVYVVLKEYINSPVNPGQIPKSIEDKLNDFVQNTPAEIVDTSQITDKHGKEHTLIMIKFDQTNLPEAYQMFFQQWYRDNITMDLIRRYLWIIKSYIAFTGTKEECEFYIEATKYNL
jgi:hypothetical protein